MEFESITTTRSAVILVRWKVPERRTRSIFNIQYALEYFTYSLSECSSFTLLFILLLSLPHWYLSPSYPVPPLYDTITMQRNVQWRKKIPQTNEKVVEGKGVLLPLFMTTTQLFSIRVRIKYQFYIQSVSSSSSPNISMFTFFLYVCSYLGDWLGGDTCLGIILMEPTTNAVPETTQTNHHLGTCLVLCSVLLGVNWRAQFEIQTYTD